MSLGTATAGQRPLRIGLSSCMFHPDPERPIFKGKRLCYLEESMAHWVQRRGHAAYLLPNWPTTDTSIDAEQAIATLLAGVDGVILVGGVDVAPEGYGETPLQAEWAGDRERDLYEFALFDQAVAANKPVLGICRGLQVINVALGGSLYQDINTQVPGSLVHRNWDIYEHNYHDVTLEPGSYLANLYNNLPGGRINSIHHQAIKDVAPGMQVQARSPTDNIIEAIHYDDPAHPERYILAVQWHPEFQRPQESDLLSTDPLLEDFFAACQQRIASS